jgi:hypothetical protein
MGAVRAFGRFWYELIVGDDWKIAVAVLVALAAAGGLLLATGTVGRWWPVLAAVVVAAGFASAILIDVRPARRPPDTPL